MVTSSSFVVSLSTPLGSILALFQSLSVMLRDPVVGIIAPTCPLPVFEVM